MAVYGTKQLNYSFRSIIHKRRWRRCSINNFRFEILQRSYKAFYSTRLNENWWEFERAKSLPYLSRFLCLCERRSEGPRESYKSWHRSWTMCPQHEVTNLYWLFLFAELSESRAGWILLLCVRVIREPTVINLTISLFAEHFTLKKSITIMRCPEHASIGNTRINQRVTISKQSVCRWQVRYSC